MESPEIPETLRPIPKLNPDEVTATRVMRMSNGKINSKTMDMARIDASANLGETEIWDIRNLVGMDHPFHLDVYQFQVFERNGEPVSQTKWEDTVNVPGFLIQRAVMTDK